MNALSPLHLLETSSITSLGPDAALLEAFSRWQAVDNARIALCAAGEDTDSFSDECDTLMKPWNLLAQEIEEQPAVTQDGIRAKAYVLRGMLDNHVGFGPDDVPGIYATPSEQLAWTLVNDMLRQSVPQGSDAELMAACTAFDELERAYIATGTGYEFGSPEEDAALAEQNRISKAQRPLVSRMFALRATTHAGQVARARSLALCNPSVAAPGPGTEDEILLTAVLRDLIGEGAPA